MQDSLSNEPGAEAPDGELFAIGPARDARYTVKERWRDCENFPGDHPLHHVEFTHRQMNEEVNGLECSAACLADYPQADWELRMWFARQCADEARHARMFRRRLEGMGAHVGQFPVMNFQYRIICRADSLLGRLTIQNRTFEAGGLDAVAWVARKMHDEGDAPLADFFESQLADEILHVRFANEWLRKLIRDDPRQLLDMSKTLGRAARGFRYVMGNEGTEGVYYPTDRLARLEAGFTEDEVKTASELGTQVASGELRGHPRS
ncbi:hypothetical protein GCM10028796_57840 [Ramlibacter monticola]|uniref:DUF455 family protein n=1 Tax=Ramlibacter monticola TaxID=1926872 RepID=A0A937CUA6_9BURK|nr:DUF455 family protein [Ramlibacter monticola]MBL0391832.1 DUF455 family protein [Ramlibacter monticola]